MKKPKDVAELATRLANAASTPLAVPPPAVAAPLADEAEPVEAKPAEKTASPKPKVRKTPNRRSVSVFLRMSDQLFEEYDKEAVRRTKATGRGVTVQQVILERLEQSGSAA